MNQVTNPCPSWEEWLRFLDGDHPEDDLSTLSSHLDHCSACQSLLEERQREAWEYLPVESVSNVSPDLLTTDASRYRRLSHHATGGLGTVYKALDLQLDRVVALKEIRDERSNDPDNLLRFVREARVTGMLEHPGIVPVYGIGRDERYRLFYTMRFVEGDSLQQTIAKLHGRKPSIAATHVAEWTTSTTSVEVIQPIVDFAGTAFRRLLNRFVTICQTMGYVHSRGVIHRDLKPANIMLGKHGETLIVDWGLATHVEGPSDHSADNSIPLGDTQITHEGHFVGTPHYASPEQASGNGALGPSSDIFSLGAILYNIVTGQAPFKGDSTEEVLARAREGLVEPFRNCNLAIPGALQAICCRAMSRNRDDRYVSAEALADDVESFLADDRVLAWREPVIHRVRRWTRRHLGLVASIVTAVVLAAIAVPFGAIAYERSVTQELSILQAKAQTAWEHGEVQNALDYLRAAIALDPGKIERDLLLLRWMIGANQIEEADLHATAIEPNITSENRAEFLFLKGDLLELKSPNGEGLTLIREVQSGLQSEADRQYVRAMLASSTAEAMEASQSSLALNPYQPQVREQLIILARFTGQHEVASRQLQLMKVISPTSGSLPFLEVWESAMRNDEPALSAATDLMHSRYSQAEISYVNLFLEDLKKAKEATPDWIGDTDAEPFVRNFLSTILNNRVRVQGPGDRQAALFRIPGVVSRNYGRMMEVVWPPTFGAAPTDEQEQRLLEYLDDAVKRHPDGMLHFERGLIRVAGIAQKLEAERKWTEYYDNMAIASSAFQESAQIPWVIGELKTVALYAAAMSEFGKAYAKLMQQNDYEAEIKTAVRLARARVDTGVPLCDSHAQLLRMIAQFAGDIELKREIIQLTGDFASSSNDDRIRTFFALEMEKGNYQRAFQLVESLGETPQNRDERRRMMAEAMEALQSFVSEQTAVDSTSNDESPSPSPMNQD